MEIRERWVVSPMWRQVTAFLGVMFFIFVADASLSDFVPGYLQGILGSPLLMGIVMSSSSVAGLLLDLVFAKLFRKTNIKRMLVYTIVGSLGFSLSLLSSTIRPYSWILLLAMVIWGLYYEFFGFASQKFVVSIAPPGKRTAVWSVMETIKCLAYSMGPLVMSQFVQYGNKVMILIPLGITFVSFLLFLLVPIKEKVEPVMEHEKLTIWHQLSHWRVLFVHIWPMVTLGLVLGIIDSTYWTTGTVVNDLLQQKHPIGGLFLTLYMLSSIFVGFVFGKSLLAHGKKRLAEVCMLLSGIVLTGMTLFSSVWWILFIVFVSSVLSALAWPLLDAVYTDLLARMGKEQVHMMSLKNSSTSLAYIVGPILAGLIATIAGELQSFVYLGWFVIIVSGILLCVTPKKLILPQLQIQSWE